jgi:hypothetical protein
MVFLKRGSRLLQRARLFWPDRNVRAWRGPERLALRAEKRTATPHGLALARSAGAAGLCPRGAARLNRLAPDNPELRRALAAAPLGAPAARHQQLAPRHRAGSENRSGKSPRRRP